MTVRLWVELPSRYSIQFSSHPMKMTFGGLSASEAIRDFADTYEVPPHRVFWRDGPTFEIVQPSDGDAVEFCLKWSDELVFVSNPLSRLSSDDFQTSVILSTARLADIDILFQLQP